MRDLRFPVGGQVSGRVGFRGGWLQVGQKAIPESYWFHFPKNKRNQPRTSHYCVSLAEIVVSSLERFLSPLVLIRSTTLSLPSTCTPSTIPQDIPCLLLPHSMPSKPPVLSPLQPKRLRVPWLSEVYGLRRINLMLRIPKDFNVLFP